MKSHNQILMVSLAVVFAIALALTVALICLSSAERGKAPTDSTQPPTRPEGPTLPFPTATDEPLTDPPAVTVFLPVETDAPITTEEIGNGLRFTRNGNGTCTLSGIGTCRDAFVVIPAYSPAGDRVVAIADGALMGCDGITALQIPETVTDIGYLAFANCKNLIYISVSPENLYYRDEDGVLYTADGKTLLLYPPMRAGEVFFLSASVTRIADMAFYGCTYLASIHYGGSAELWDTISIGSRNHSLTAASVVFSATPR